MRLLSKQISPPLKASIWFMVGNVVQQSVSLITTPIFTRILSENDYGIINVYQSWLGILSVIITLSLTAGVYNNAMIDYKDDIDGFTSSMLALTSLSTICFYIIFLIFKPSIINFMNLSNILINIMFLNIFLNPAMGFWMLRQKFEYKYKLSIFISIITTIFGAALSYILVVSVGDNKPTAKIIGSCSLLLIVNIFIYFKLIIKGKKFICLEYWKYALVFNVPLIPHYLSSIVLAQSDRILISNIQGNTEAGLYGVAYSAASVISIVWTAINASWIPWTLKQMKNECYMEIKQMTKPLIIIAGIASVGFVMFAPEIIQIIAAPAYLEAMWVIPPVVLGMYFTFIYTLFANIEFYYKKTTFIMIASVSSAIVNIILNIIFIPIFGYVAAAYTTMVGYFLLSLVHYKFMKKISNAEIYDIKFICYVSILVVLSMIISMLLYKIKIVKYLFILVISMILITNKNKLIKKYKY